MFVWLNTTESVCTKAKTQRTEPTVSVTDVFGRLRRTTWIKMICELFLQTQIWLINTKYIVRTNTRIASSCLAPSRDLWTWNSEWTLTYVFVGHKHQQHGEGKSAYHFLFGLMLLFMLPIVKHGYEYFGPTRVTRTTQLTYKCWYPPSYSTLSRLHIIIARFLTTDCYYNL